MSNSLPWQRRKVRDPAIGRQRTGMLVLAIGLATLARPAAAQPADPAMRGHGGAIRSIAALAPDVAATGGFDTAIIVWSLAAGSARRVLRLHDAAVTALTPVGGQCAVSGGDDGRLVRWCAGEATASSEAGQLIGTHAGAVSAIAVSPDGSRLATASWDRTVRLWPLAAAAAPGGPSAPGTIVAEHRAPATGVGFAPDGRTVISASYDGEVRATDTGDGDGAGRPARATARAQLPTAVNGLVVLGDGRLVLTGADGSLRFLTGGLAPALDIDLPDGPLTALAASPDGKVVAVGGMRTPVTLIDTAGGGARRQIMGPGLPIWALSFSSDGRELLTGGADGALRRWNVATGEALGAAGSQPAEIGPRAAQEDGARVFRACIACHTTRPGEGHRAGPTLHGVFGRRIATAPGYRYSDALKTLDIVWTGETIARLFEVGPTVYTPGTKMPEQRITDPADRKALVEWLERETRP